MANVNKVLLIGRLTRDVELRYTPSGVAICDLGLALNRKYTTKDGEKREETTFVDVSVWNKQAENCAQYLSKGREVYVEGYLKMDSWEDKKSGEKRSKLKVEADNVQFLGGPDRTEQQPSRQAAEPRREPQRQQIRRDDPNLPPSRPMRPPVETYMEGGSEEDDDLPF